jgi:hypothetical protein
VPWEPGGDASANTGVAATRNAAQPRSAAALLFDRITRITPFIRDPMFTVPLSQGQSRPLSKDFRRIATHVDVPEFFGVGEASHRTRRPFGWEGSWSSLDLSPPNVWSVALCRSSRKRAAQSAVTSENSSAGNRFLNIGAGSSILARGAIVRRFGACSLAVSLAGLAITSASYGLPGQLDTSFGGDGKVTTDVTTRVRPPPPFRKRSK